MLDGIPLNVLLKFWDYLLIEVLEDTQELLPCERPKDDRTGLEPRT